MKLSKIAKLSGIALASCLLLTACEEDEEEGEPLNNQTETSITQNKTNKPAKPVKAKQVAMKNVDVEHTIEFNGKIIPITATYGIDKRYVNNWWFTNNEEINLSIKPDKNVGGISLGVNNIYSDVTISSRYLKYNGVRQDSVDQSYSNMPNGFVSINKDNDYSLAFQVESINENETSFNEINGYGDSDTERISENDLREHAYGAKLNVVWTLAIKDHGQTYFKTVHDTIGLPYKQNSDD